MPKSDPSPIKFLNWFISLGLVIINISLFLQSLELKEDNKSSVYQKLEVIVLTELVIGLNLVPLPPAKIIPFITKLYFQFF